MTRGPRFLSRLPFVATAVILISLAGSAAAQKTAPSAKIVDPGSTWVVNKTTCLDNLTIGKDAHISAAPGHDVTMTIDGVETGINPGVYTGKIVLTPAAQNLVEYSFENVHLVHHFRQALFLDKSGVVEDKSVLPAAGKYSLRDGVITGVKIKSDDESFNGIYATGGTYSIRQPVIDFVGNGGNDFAGYGAAIMSAGKDTTLIIDGGKIHTRGAVRTAAVADKGSHLIVKNSEIEAHDGKLPADYLPNVMPGKMMSVPWMLGLSGNSRGTNLLGDNTSAAYINSTVSAENWGALSNDIGSMAKLTVIDSRANITGKNGYAAYC